ncbi:MAG: TolC family protein [Chitinophagaceae bacterium]|nr:MAG: TolC family protein [Chitinophagaceae bacterium]
MRIRPVFLLGLALLLLGNHRLFAQDTKPGPAVADSLTLQECIDYALKNQPTVRQSSIDQEIAERDIKINLSGWYPQVNATGNYQHNLKLPVFVLPNFTDPSQPPSIVRNGLKNTSSAMFQADQAIFSNQLLLASRGAKFVRSQAVQNIESNKINATVDVSKAFYDILTNLQQLNILQENIARLEKQYKDAKAQYDNGLVDKTDYKRATIAIANSKADLKRTNELLKFKYASLKEMMGYPTESPLRLSYDSAKMEGEMLVDTLVALDYEKRIEYRQLMTQKQIQGLNVEFYRRDFLPTVSGFINYNFVYQNNELSKLYSQEYPNSAAGLTVRLPIFQGTRRIQNLRREQLAAKRIDLDEVNLRNQINTQYQQAMASYKSSMNDWITARDNVELSKEVYSTIKLQYDEGIKTYLDLMTAETDLRTAQITYLNALYGVLASKLDVQQSLGTINLN